jgi:hypothetical protein
MARIVPARHHGTIKRLQRNLRAGGAASIPEDPAELFASATGHTPTPWQKEILRSTAPQVALNISRQGGKSTMTAVKALHVALKHPESLVLLAAPGQKQAMELHHKCRTFYRRLEQPLGDHGDSAVALQFGNNSRILALSGNPDTTRGYSAPRLVVVDEASRVLDELMITLRPMLAASPEGAQLVALSTPAGKRGWWYHDVWADETDPSWKRYKVPATEIPWISKDFLDRELYALGQAAFEEEFLCIFGSGNAGVFDPAQIAAAHDDECPIFNF